MAENNVVLQIDAYPPAEMAARAERIARSKVQQAPANTLVLAILAGSFIGLGALAATVVTTDTGLGYGITRLIMGLAFSLGLILVVIAGAELFTGNNLIVMAFAGGKVRIEELVRNWVLVYAGNLIGAVLTALFVYWTAQWMADSYKVGANALIIANAKVNLSWMQAFARGVLANALVCLAVWLVYSARSNTDKILAIIPPITAFVAAGLEHSIANMYFIPMGIFLAHEPAVVSAAGLSVAQLSNLTWSGFVFQNLIPVTLGNILGGAGMVGLIYWFVYLRTEPVLSLPGIISQRCSGWWRARRGAREVGIQPASE